MMLNLCVVVANNVPVSGPKEEIGRVRVNVNGATGRLRNSGLYPSALIKSKIGPQPVYLLTMGNHQRC